MTELGRYQVVGPRAYRGHQPGSTFEGRLDRNAEGRAIMRGSIQLLERVPNDLVPGTYRLPDGWAATATQKGSGIANG